MQDHKLFLVIFYLEKDLSADAAITQAVKSIL